MKTIDLNELKALYQAEIDDANMRNIEIINKKDFSNKPMDDAHKAALKYIDEFDKILK